MIGRDSEYNVVAVENGIVFIVDTDRGDRRSVTNDAERVVMELNNIYPGQRIMYRDSMLKWDELVHDNGNFKGYRPGVAPG